MCTDLTDFVAGTNLSMHARIYVNSSVFASREVTQLPGQEEGLSLKYSTADKPELGPWISDCTDAASGVGETSIRTDPLTMQPMQLPRSLTNDIHKVHLINQTP